MKLPLPPWTCPHLKPQPSQQGRRPDVIPAPGIPWTLDTCAEFLPPLCTLLCVHATRCVPQVPHFVTSFLGTRSSICLKWHFATWSERKLRLQEVEAFAWNFDTVFWAPACSFWSTAQSRLIFKPDLARGGDLYFCRLLPIFTSCQVWVIIRLWVWTFFFFFFKPEYWSWNLYFRASVVSFKTVTRGNPVPSHVSCWHSSQHFGSLLIFLIIFSGGI